jgi:hypothetical protein
MNKTTAAEIITSNAIIKSMETVGGPEGVMVTRTGGGASSSCNPSA